jgi:hypothetical protein
MAGKELKLGFCLGIMGGILVSILLAGLVGCSDETTRPRPQDWYPGENGRIFRLVPPSEQEKAEKKRDRTARFELRPML